MSAEYMQLRIEDWLAASQRPDVIKRQIKLWTGDDAETRRILNLPFLSSISNAIRVDPATGELFVSRWNNTSGIDMQYKILGNEQNGRNYHESPPKTMELEELVPNRFTLGIETAMRGARHVKQGYVLDGEGMGREARQMADIFGRLDDISAIRRHFRELTDEDLIRLRLESEEFMVRAGLKHPRNPEKRKVVKNESNGVTDKNGNVSFIAAYSRELSSRYAALRRLEQAFPAISDKYDSIYSQLANERGATRFRLVQAVVRMDRIEHLSAGDGQIPLDAVLSLEYEALRLLRGVRVRPYLAKARKAAVNLGLADFASKPDWEIYRLKRRGNGFRSAADHFRRGEWEKGLEVLEITKKMLLKVLEMHKDVETVKEGYHENHPVKKKKVA